MPKVTSFQRGKRLVPLLYRHGFGPFGRGQGARYFLGADAREKEDERKSSGGK